MMFSAFNVFAVCVCIFLLLYLDALCVRLWRQGSPCNFSAPHIDVKLYNLLIVTIFLHLKLGVGLHDMDNISYLCI